MQPVSGSPIPASLDIQKDAKHESGETKNSPSKFDEVAETSKAGNSALKKVGEVVDGIRADEARLDNAMRRMSSGRVLDSVEMLRVQSLVYGYSQRVELASKVVESATSGVKQMLNTQV